MKVKLNIIVLSIAISASLLIAYFVCSQRDNAAQKDIKNFFLDIKSIERAIITNIPIYSDYTTTHKEKILRKYLIRDHIKKAKQLGLKKITNEKMFSEALKNKSLIEIDSGTEQLFYFYNVPNEHRYLSPKAYQCLLTVASEFQKTLNKYGITTTIKIAISSALRIETYQKELMNRNKNASIESSHSYGISFDIFYDDFYIVLPEPRSQLGIGSSIIEDVRRQQGFLLAHALRRQLRTVLAETLVSLQQKDILYAILEKKQRCYHITVQ